MTDADLEIVSRGLQVVANRCGLIVAKSRSEQVTSAATVTFVKIDGEKFLVTAAHVFSGLSERGRLCLQVLPPDALVAPETLRPPMEFELPASSYVPVPCGNEARLDIAVFRAPDDLVAARHLGWFDAEEGASVLQELRAEVPLHRDPRLAGKVIGFPTFSRFTDTNLRTQAYGSFAMWGIIERFDDPPEITGRMPQIVLELDVPTPELVPADVSPLVRTCIEKFWSMSESNLASEDDPSPLGGYSGGPFAYLCESGQYLLGTVKDGGVRLGGHAFVTPLDAIIAGVRTAPPTHARDGKPAPTEELPTA